MGFEYWAGSELEKSWGCIGGAQSSCFTCGIPWWWVVVALNSEVEYWSALCKVVSTRSEKYVAVSSKEVETIDVFPGNLDGVVEWELADLAGIYDLSSGAFIRFDYTCRGEECSVVSASITSSVADTLPLIIRGVEAMSRASILEIPVGALQSTVVRWFPYWGNWVQVGVSYLEQVGAEENLSSTKRRLGFVQDVVTTMSEQVSGHETQLRDVEAASATAESASAIAEYTIQSLKFLTALELVSSQDRDLLTKQVAKQRDRITRLHE